MSKIKKFIGLLVLSLIVTFPLITQASTTVYNSTYSMTGGVESKRFNTLAPGTFQVETWGKENYAENYTFTVYLKKDVIGVDPVISSKDDHYSSGYQSTTFNITKERGSGNYYAYLRNYTGYLMEGEITITIKDSK
jgi:hypothetical protein